MTGRLAAVAIWCFAALACTTTSVPPAPGLPEPVPARLQASAASPEVADRVRHANAILLAAQAAVQAGDEVEFDACETVLLHMIGEQRDLIAANPQLEDVATEALRELDTLAVELARAQEAGEETTEVGTDAVPTDLEPAPQDRVADVQTRMTGELFDLPVRVNADVTALLDFYTGRYRERFAAALERGADYLPYLRTELGKLGLPEDLAYLPLIESGYNPRARSRARAQGLWQFMKGTAKLYDLRVDGVIDERNDPYLATQAAARHLRDLYAMFGDWELVLAAYNSGAGRVQRALARSKGSTDYWSIRRHLPRETRNYVPAMWAALVVAKSPESFGFPRFPERSLCIDRVTVAGALDLEVLAERTGIPVGELEALNPALVRRLTPAEGTYQLAVPCGFGTCATTTLASIPPSERIRRILHVVKKGDTPSGIARRYGSTVDALVAANTSRILRTLRVGETVIVPRVGAEPQPRRQTRSRTTTAAASPPARGQGNRYVVRSGDTLYDIARRFGTSPNALKRANNLRGSLIHPGDVLVIE